MSVNYRVVIRDPQGENPRTVGNAISIEASRAINTIGAATIILPDEYNPYQWQRDTQFEIWRVSSGGFPYLLGNTIWFGRKFVWQYSQKRWAINCLDTNCLLDRRIIAYTGETDFAEKIPDWGSDGPADNLMREFVRENLGSDVENAFRDLSAYFEIEEDRSLAPVTQKEASFQELWGVLTSLADDAKELGVPLYFNVDPTVDGKFRFRVSTGALGQDRTLLSAPIVFGPAYKNLTDIEIEWDYTEEKTVVYAGGDGEGAVKLWVAVGDASRSRKSPFGRLETFIDIRDQDDENLLTAEARAELAKHRPKLRLTGLAVDTPTMQFGRDYFYGDRVSAIVGDLRFDCLVDAFSVSYQEGRESDLSIRLNGETTL